MNFPIPNYKPSLTFLAGTGWWMEVGGSEGEGRGGRGGGGGMLVSMATAVLELFKLDSCCASLISHLCGEEFKS